MMPSICWPVKFWRVPTSALHARSQPNCCWQSLPLTPSEPWKTEEQYAAMCHSEVSSPSEFMPGQTLLLAVNVPSGNACCPAGVDVSSWGSGILSQSG